jgi:hypothetical protein
MQHDWPSIIAGWWWSCNPRSKNRCAETRSGRITMKKTLGLSALATLGNMGLLARSSGLGPTTACWPIDLGEEVTNGESANATKAMDSSNPTCLQKHATGHF